MTQQEVSKKLIEGVIKVISREGLDKASAKVIEAETGINVVYIYRCFKDKEDMFAQTFAELDKELITAFANSLLYLSDVSVGIEERFRLVFSKMWRFLLGDSDKCICYIRYYNSRYFQTYSYRTHKEAYAPLVNKMSEVFVPMANVWMLLTHALSTMLSFAVKVFDGIVPDDEDTAEHVFRLVYYSLTPYFKKDDETIGEKKE